MRVVFAVLGAAFLGCSARAPGSDAVAKRPPPGEIWLQKEQLAQMRVEVIQRREIMDTLLVGGRVAFDDLRVSHVFSPVNGRVTQLFAQPGEHVKLGSPLVQISSPDVGSAFSDLVKAQADLGAAQHEYQRQKELYEAHAGAQRDFEAAEGNWKKAKAEFERARQKAKMLHADQAERVTQEFVLRAPIEGEVVARNVNPGVEVQGQYSGGTPPELFTIGSLEEVYIFADIHELELAHVRKGTPVKVQVVSYPNRTFPGIVDWVSDVLDPNTRTARLRASIKNPDRLLKPEMYATVEVAEPRDNQIALPRSALVHLGEQTVVFVSEGALPDGRVRITRRPVHVDEDISGPYYPVDHGLEPGDAVVVEGGLLLSEMT